MDEDSVKLDNEDSPAYNLWWGVGATGINQNVIDLTNDNGPMSQGKNVIDLTQSSPARSVPIVPLLLSSRYSVQYFL
ncbi:hypothetical protein F4604DRAFT_1929018 [Suillus subluteus]|nr:hypothetical protein F4604DRAFT_1929018 [Suillus subluteus]